MLRPVLLILLIAGCVCEWSLSSIINAVGRKDRRITPHHDYTTSATDLEKFFNQLELFSPLSLLSSSFPMDIRETKGTAS